MTADPSAHPDVEALDTYLDTVLGGPSAGSDADGVRAHLAGCAYCAETVEALRRVRADLAGLGPVEMPAEVAGRISAALRAESGSTSLPDHHGLRRVGTGRRPGPARSARAGGPRSGVGRRTGWLAGAALVTVALLAGGLLLATRDSGGQSASTSAVAGRAPSLSAQSSAGADRAGPRAAAPEAVPTYDRTTVTGLAAGVPADVPYAATNGSAGSDLEQCLRRLAGTGEVALFRRIEFEGLPAVGAVLRTGAGLRVVVVDPACSAADAERSVRYSTAVAG